MLERQATMYNYDSLGYDAAMPSSSRARTAAAVMLLFKICTIVFCANSVGVTYELANHRVLCLKRK